jgi:broad specificity phosphatase PhoE
MTQPCGSFTSGIGTAGIGLTLRRRTLIFHASIGKSPAIIPHQAAKAGLRPQRGVEAAVNRLLIAYPGRDIILVAHFGVILTQVQRALGIPAAATLAHEIKPLSVTCLTEDQGGWSAQSINHFP